eukprot:Opistho-1_new@8419
MPADTGAALLCRRRAPPKMSDSSESRTPLPPRVLHCAPLQMAERPTPAQPPKELAAAAEAAERLMLDDKIVKLSLLKLECQRRPPAPAARSPSPSGSPLKRLVLIHNLMANVARDRASQRQILVDLDTRLRAEALRELEQREAAGDVPVGDDQIHVPASAEAARCAGAVRAECGMGAEEAPEADGAADCAVSIHVVSVTKAHGKGPNGRPWRRLAHPALASVGCSVDVLHLSFFLLVMLEVVFITLTLMSA